MPEKTARTEGELAPAERDRRGNRLIQAGLVVTALGMVLTIVAMLPLVTDIDLPSAFWGLSMLTGVGLAMVIVGLARTGRRRSRAQRAARATRG